MVLWLAACVTDVAFDVFVDTGGVRGDSVATGPGAAPEVVVKVTAPDPDAPLVRRIDLIADVPVTGSVSWGERGIALDDPSETHSVLLVGLRAGRANAVTVELSSPRSLIYRQDLSVSVPEVPAHFPRGTVLASPRDGVGDTLVPLRVPEGDPPAPHDVAAVYDDLGQIVYWLDVHDTLMDVRAVDDGLVALVGTGNDARLEHYRWDGLLLGSWTLSPSGSRTVVQTSWRGAFHHDGGFVPDDSGRLLALGRAPIEVVDYPASYDDPSLTRSRTVADDVVLVFDPDGVVEREVHLSSLLPTSRIGYGSLDTTPEGWGDWAHANAVEWQPDGSILLSLRHQDLVLLLDREGRIAWMAGQDANLTPELRSLLLQPVGETALPWHQHGAHLGPVRGDGTRLLTLFDNGNDRAAPFTGTPRVTDPALLSSRVVAYAVDETARTIREEWSFGHPSGPLYSEATGDADQLPNGHVLSAWGYLDRTPQGPTNAELGLGRRSARIVEIAPPAEPVGGSDTGVTDTGAPAAREPQLVWELLLDVLAADNPWGWTGARAQRVQLPGGPVPP